VIRLNTEACAWFGHVTRVKGTLLTPFSKVQCEAQGSVEDREYGGSATSTNGLAWTELAELKTDRDGGRLGRMPLCLHDLPAKEHDDEHLMIHTQGLDTFDFIVNRCCRPNNIREFGFKSRGVACLFYILFRSLRSGFEHIDEQMQ
jgi:hypothetical protein